MPVNVFKSEKDSLAFLGLMSNMFKLFDEQFIGPDGEKTHTKGLNIHALLIDNLTGNVLGLEKNSIHHYNNPLLHAEQLTLNNGAKKKNLLSPRDTTTTSVESYYRNYLFNDPTSYDSLKAGATIYTSLEPCPFCTSALLVSRVKRIVFITPDITYGNSFYTLWTTYYSKYDIRYEQMKLEEAKNSSVVGKAALYLKDLMNKVKHMKDIPSTLYFDSLKSDLSIIYKFFSSCQHNHLITSGIEKQLNSVLLSDLQNLIL